MSGGSFDYLYSRIEEASQKIYEEKSKEEIEFSKLLKNVAELMHSIEWAYSGDTNIDDFKKDWNKFKAENLK